MKNIVTFLIVLLLCACRSIPEEVHTSLNLAGPNKGELKKVLRHYGWHERDSLKFRAACFLIENMRWHYGTRQVQNIDQDYDYFCRVADSCMYVLWQERSGRMDSLRRSAQELRKRLGWLKDSLKKHQFQTSDIVYEPFSDLQTLDSKFLIHHIDHAFLQWEKIRDHCSFSEFCEGILPYRPMRGYPYLYSGDKLEKLFGKYVNFDSSESTRQRINRYNNCIIGMKNFFGKSPDKNIGIYSLSFAGDDCVDIAAYGCTVLRACGIPVMVEFCDAYRQFAGRHYCCCTPDSTGEWLTFSPESSLPERGKWMDGFSMNLYRQYFGAQKDSPYFLRREGEKLPALFALPCIREITAERAKVFRVTLPFEQTTNNRLAYLAGFQSKRDMAPVTWGEIDTVHRKVCFSNTMEKRLYFPVYYEGEELVPFGDPFYVLEDSTTAEGFRLYSMRPDSGLIPKVNLTRKFPQKKKMVQLAENLVGGVFYGANKNNLSDAKVLYTIKKVPGPYIQEIVLPSPGAYRYYYFKAPEEHPYANISVLEFLTEKKYGYKNVLPPTPRTALFTDLFVEENQELVKLINPASWEKMKKKAAFDGNMQTAPSAYRMIQLKLPKSQIVTRIRFAPKNEDNGIHRGEQYELCYYQNGWQSCGVQTATKEYLEFYNVPKGALCWLRNHSTGTEEMPFLIRNGKQVFLYPEIIK